MIPKRSRAQRRRVGEVVSSAIVSSPAPRAAKSAARNRRRAPYATRPTRWRDVFCVNQPSAFTPLSSLTKTAPSDTDAVVAGARQRASSWHTSPRLGAVPRRRRSSSRRATSDRGSSVSLGGGGANRARSSAQVRLRGKAERHQLLHRLSVQLGTPIVAQASRSVDSWLSTLASTTTTSR